MDKSQTAEKAALRTGSKSGPGVVVWRLGPGQDPDGRDGSTKVVIPVARGRYGLSAIDDRGGVGHGERGEGE